MLKNEFQCKEPLVSIITPSFNQGQFIEENIHNIKCQDYPNIEHIVIDGGSNDLTVDILKRFEGTYNLRWISEPDEGHADAVNKGLNMAKGDIIGWLNSDDVYFDRSTISTVVKTFQKNPKADIIYGDIAYIWEDGTILRVQCLPGFRYARLLRSCFLGQPAVFFRRHVIEEHKLDKRLKVAIDYEYWLRIGMLYHWHHIPRILAADRNHRWRISVAQATKLKEVGEKLRWQYLGQPSLKMRLEWELDKIFSGLPRRLKGLVVLYSMRRKKDFAFKAKIIWNMRTVKNQLFPPKLEKLKP